ncbi:MAG: UPF0280 family protein [Candidatus Methylarchaceae archaeon HK02M1]|nr:UPF0280 family protein [Candidatus Methylarchaceae archaeon HK02M1]
MNSQMVFSRGLYRMRRTIRQSNLLIISDIPQAISTAINSVILHRSFLERYIRCHPKYQFSLEPIKVEDDAPKVIKLAAFAAEIAEVGPMAAVPGALAEIAVEDMVHHGALVNLVENGGEIASLSHKPLNVAIYAGPSPVSGRIGLHLSPKDFPIGIATSSATVGSALSLGEADAVVIIAESSSLADAVATAVCNAVQGPDIEASVQSGLELAETIPYVRAAIIIRGTHVGKVGRLPKLLKLNGSLDDLFEAGLYEIMPHTR